MGTFSNILCYHILAAKLAVGQRLDDSKKKIDLTQLHRNSRSRGSKESGRKRPHPLDCEVIPAPDAMVPTKVPDANLLTPSDDNVTYVSMPTSNSSLKKKTKEDDTKGSKF